MSALSLCAMEQGNAAVALVVGPDGPEGTQSEEEQGRQASHRCPGEHGEDSTAASDSISGNGTASAQAVLGLAP